MVAARRPLINLTSKDQTANDTPKWNASRLHDIMCGAVSPAPLSGVPLLFKDVDKITYSWPT